MNAWEYSPNWQTHVTRVCPHGHHLPQGASRCPDCLRATSRRYRDRHRDRLTARQRGQPRVRGELLRWHMARAVFVGGGRVVPILTFIRRKQSLAAELCARHGLTPEQANVAAWEHLLLVSEWPEPSPA